MFSRLNSHSLLNISDTTRNEDITFADTKRFPYRYRLKIFASTRLYSCIRNISKNWNFNSIQHSTGQTKSLKKPEYKYDKYAENAYDI